MIERAIELASRPSSAQIWRKCKYLVIDEISMIDGEYFEVNIHFNYQRENKILLNNLWGKL